MLLNKVLFFKDPVHGEVNFYKNDQWFLKLIDTPEFQRLNRIRQLGVSFCIFPSATHTRFAHSLGVFEMARRFVDHMNVPISAAKRKIVLSAALLHDIGHGPNSHSFEKYTGIKHEEFTKKIILNRDGEIYKVLTKNKVNPMDVVNVIDKKYCDQWINELISSQIDVDRIDYLLRDSHYTGATYGLIDISILAKRIMVVKNRLVFIDKAISAVENFLIGRYHMYEQVYNNKHSRVYERIVELIFKRVKELNTQNYSFKDTNHLMSLIHPWLTNTEYSVDDFLKLDDWTFHSLIVSWKDEQDSILQMLLHAYENYQDFDCEEYSDKAYNAFVKKCKAKKLDPKYYLSIIEVKSTCLYDTSYQPIMVYDEKTEKITNINKTSNVLKTNRKTTTKKLLMINKEIY